MQDQIITSRRNVLGMTTTGVLSVAALGILANEPAMAAMKGKGKSASKGDVDILNVALGLEHEAIEAYQIGAETGLLDKGVLAVAVGFQSQHKGHRDALIGAIKQLGGSPVAAKSRADYVTGLNVASIKGATDILRLAQKLEKGAANAYIGVIPSLGDKGLAQVAAKLAADEASHWTVLSQALGDAYPSAPLMFG